MFNFIQQFKIYLLNGIMVFILISVFGAGNVKAQAERNFNNNYNRLKEQFYLTKSLLKNADTIKNLGSKSSKIPQALKKSGIDIVLKSDQKQTRVGTSSKIITGYTFWNHFEDSTGKLWIDVIEFLTKETCSDICLTLEKFGPQSSYEETPSFSYMTHSEDKELNAVGTLLMCNNLIFNFGNKVPFIISTDGNTQKELEIIEKSIDYVTKVIKIVGSQFSNNK